METHQRKQMKKIKVNNSLPAFLDSFFQDEKSEKFTRAQLKVFYTGWTEDKRYIGKECGEYMLKTLPYTPVVSYYDYDKDDFVGHASEQSIFGIVDPCREPKFVKDEDGVEWAVCDVVLYTERPDEVGRLAKKIIGHPQSLEMDPKTMQYVVNYTSDHKIKSIEFEKAEFVGVSILGKQQRPAFTGSGFFATSDFESKMEMLKNYCEEERGNTMDEQSVISTFMDLSWNEKQQAVAKALSDTAYVIDMYDEYAIAWDFSGDECVLKKFKYTLNDNGQVESISSGIPVRVTYEEIPQNIENHESTVTESSLGLGNVRGLRRQSLIFEEVIEQDPIQINEVYIPLEEEENKDQASCDPEEEKDKEDMSCGEPEKKEEDDKEDMGCTSEEDDDKNKCEDSKEEEQEETNEDPVQSEENDDKEKDDEVDQAFLKIDSSTAEQEQAEVKFETTVTDSENLEGVVNEETNNATTFSDSEKEELSFLRDLKKKEILNSFANILSKETISKYTSNLEQYTWEELEKALSEEGNKRSAKKLKVFTRFDAKQSQQGGESLADLIRQYKK